jgi:hypothetical protein
LKVSWEIKHRGTLGAYPFKLTPRRFSGEHFNNGTTQTPNIDSKSQLRAGIFLHHSLQKLQKGSDVSMGRNRKITNSCSSNKIPLEPSSMDFPLEKDQLLVQ